MRLQLHDDRSKGLSDVFIIPVFRRKLRNDRGRLLRIARRATIDILSNVEEAALDPRAWRSLGAVASVTVIALVNIVIYERC